MGKNNINSKEREDNSRKIEIPYSMFIKVIGLSGEERESKVIGLLVI